jgi:hypothetical protein
VPGCGGSNAIIFSDYVWLAPVSCTVSCGVFFEGKGAVSLRAFSQPALVRPTLIDIVQGDIGYAVTGSKCTRYTATCMPVSNLNTIQYARS